MQIRFVLAVACLIFFSACSKGPANGQSSASSAPAASAATISAFPATLEGNLAISVANDWGYFGDITVAGVEHPVAIPASIFEASGVSDTGGMVRLTVESKQDIGNSFQYIASSISKL